MAKNKKEGELIHCCLEKDISGRLADFCKETGLTKTAAIEKALDMFISYYNKTGKLKQEEGTYV